MLFCRPDQLKGEEVFVAFLKNVKERVEAVFWYGVFGFGAFLIVGVAGLMILKAIFPDVTIVALFD